MSGNRLVPLYAAILSSRRRSRLNDCHEPKKALMLGKKCVMRIADEAYGL
jgi:hypothetical protein